MSRFRIFEKVAGYEGRCNTLLYTYPKCSPTQKCLLFFGGDTQDMQGNMEKNRDSSSYVEWSLENTAEILSDRFPKHHILVVRPARMSIVHGRAFSCFDNFVPGDKYGVPSFHPTNGALKHLHKLTNSILSKIITEEKEKLPYDLNQMNYTLMGFSKGCVVLNQILHEIPSIVGGTHLKNEECSFLYQIKSMWWLDSGHSGCKDTWITDRQMLEAFAKLNINVHVHVTPYQIQDTCRPWICKEERCFSNLLKEIGVPVHRKMHFAEHPPNLLYHFNVLKDITDPAEDACNP